VLSPQIVPGQADILLGFEAAEALRWANFLRRGGLALVNSARFVPPVVTGGLYDYPPDPVGQIRNLGIEVHALDANAIALALGDLRLGNTVMLGAIADHLPFPAEVLFACVVKRFQARKPELVELNRRAFQDGRAGDTLAAP
jgi:indolepyruvate ferredoxin oxidoreductase beta subunit